MTLTVDLKPELQAVLARQAAECGIVPEIYAANLLEAALHSAVERRTDMPQNLDRFLSEMAEFSEKIPSLPDEAFSRDSIYRDHD